MVRAGNKHLDTLGKNLIKILDELPETITMADVQHHPWLHRLLLAADDLTNRSEYSAHVWCKQQGYPE